MHSWVTGRIRLAAAILALPLLMPAEPAAAQSFFDMLFGPRYSRPMPPPLPGSAYAPFDRDPYDRDPYDRRMRERGEPYESSGGGRGAGFCVRLCDGRFFPLAKPAGEASAVKLCSALCPASSTKVVAGPSIDTASGADGRTYADLPNAYLFREKVVPGCTCNGKDPFGLARIDIDDDPTLQKGDIVATRGGLQAYTGPKRSRTAGEYTPVESYSGLSRKLRQQLERTPVRGE